MLHLDGFLDREKDRDYMWFMKNNRMPGRSVNLFTKVKPSLVGMWRHLSQ